MPIAEIGGQRVLFVHIPKTGGSSVEEWLARHAPLYFVGSTSHLKTSAQHLPHSFYATLFRPGHFDYAFTVVRDPYDRLVSEYKLRRQDLENRGYLHPMTFGEWVAAQLEAGAKNPFHLDNHIRPQAGFLGGELEIFRFEGGLRAIIESVAARLRLPVPAAIPHRLGNTAAADDPPWDVQSILKVNDFYRADFELLGYARKEPSLNFRQDDPPSKESDAG